MSHETNDHMTVKGDLQAWWQRRNFAAFIEMGGDVVSWGLVNGLPKVATTEYERSTRNVVANARRNLGRTNGHAWHLIVVRDEHMRRAVRRLLNRSFPHETARKFAIVLLDRLLGASSGDNEASQPPLNG